MYFPPGGLGLYCRFHVLVHVCFHVRVHVRVHVCFYVRVRVHVRVRIRVHVRIYKSVPPQLKEGSIVSKEKEGGIIADQIFKRTPALNSDHGPVLGRLVRCLGFLVLYILWPHFLRFV
jgi:hypothetical protein